MNERLRQFFKDLLQIKEVLAFFLIIIVAVLNLWLATQLSPFREDLRANAAVDSKQDVEIAILKEDIAEIKKNSQDTNERVLDIYKLFFKN